MTTPAATSTGETPPSSSTTRVCIKNIHPSFDEAKLKNHLRIAQPSLVITDCKLLKTKDGRSRKIAFVGFQSSSHAESAVSYFDKSFAGTARLAVSLAFSTKKKPPIAEFRPWSKHSEGSSRNEKLQQQQQQYAKEQQHQKDNEEKKNKSNFVSKAEGEDNDMKIDEATRKRDEFLSVMGVATSDKQGRISKSKFWANDDAIVESKIDVATTRPDEIEAEDDKNKSEIDDNSNSDLESGDDDDDATDDVAAQIGDEGRITSDLDFLRSKKVDVDILAEESDNEGKDDDDDNDSSSAPDDSSFSSDDDNDKIDDDKHDDKESSTNILGKKGFIQQLSNSLLDRLFVRNLPFTTTEEDLFERFSEFGHVTSVHIPIDDSKRNKGYAFINFEDRDDAKLALDTMDGEDFQGRLIHILPSRPAVDQTNGFNEIELTYKERQDLSKQKEAEKSSQSWSASFLRGDAVVDNMSDRLGMSKGDILNVKDGISSGIAAVRLALGETHIISENFSFFEDHGVDVMTLEAKSSMKGGGGGGAPTRSTTMILVKNLPYDTTLEELTKVLHDIGGDIPHKILLPPSKTAALVEYNHASDARRAFRKLAYQKFKHVPLYLEWAPIKSDVKQRIAPSVPTVDCPSEGISGIVKPVLLEEDPSIDATDSGASQTIYVKNLNFSTSEDQLELVFTKAGIKPRAVKIPTKTAPKKHGTSQAVDSVSNIDTRRLSMGFGFVEFSSEVEALKAKKVIQGKVVDGHALDIKLSTKNLSTTTKISTDDKSTVNNTKLMIRNVPFEATRTELLQLFGSFGHLKKVRLPKKFDGSHRGFAFCEFVTSKEAQNAMTTLSRTHLYGRHLVLEWAEMVDAEKVDVEAIREKTKRDATRAGLGTPKKTKGKHLKF